MRNIGVMTLILMFLFLAVRSSVGGMSAYWWFSIFRPQDWVYASIDHFRFPMISTLLFFLLSMFRGKFPEVKDSIAQLMLFWYFLMVVSNTVYGCSDIFLKIDPLQYMFLLFFAILLSAAVIDNQLHLTCLIAVVGLSLGFYSGKAGISGILGGGASTYGANNLKGLFSGSNAFAMGSGILVFYIIFLYQQSTNKLSTNLLPAFLKIYPKALSVAMLLLILGTIFNIISLASRGSAIATFLGLFILFVLSGKWFKKTIIMIPLLVITASVIPLPEGYEERIQSAFKDEEELDDSAASRPHFWRAAAKMAQAYPIGVGPGCYREYYDLFDDSNGKFGRNRDVHSSHFQVLAEAGYLGLIIWFSLFFFSYLRLLKLRKIIKRHAKQLENPLFYTQLCNAIICSMTVCLVGGSMYALAFNDLIWLNFGITIVLTKLVNKEVSLIPANGNKTNTKLKN